MPSVSQFALVASLIVLLIPALQPATAGPSSEDSHATQDEGEEKKKGKGDEILTCGEELIGDWTVSYDAYAFRVFHQAAEISWKIQTHLDPEVSSGFLVEVTRPRRTAGYVKRPEIGIWYNPPKIKLTNSHEKPYKAFAGGLSHTYERSVGFGMRQLWLEPDNFWYPHEDVFKIRTEQRDAKKAMKFEKTLAQTDQKLRIELYLPMYSSSQPVSYGELTDTKGLAEAMKVAAAKNHELWGVGAECRMGALHLEPVEEKDAKKKGGH